jgi:myosin heavy subunit
LVKCKNKEILAFECLLLNKAGIFIYPFPKKGNNIPVIKHSVLVKLNTFYDVIYHNIQLSIAKVMVQQFYYREFSSMKKRVERFLRKTSRLRVVDKVEDSSQNRITYSLTLKWSLLNLILNIKKIKLTIEKIDETVTRLELVGSPKESQVSKLFPATISNKFLNNITFLF